MRSELLDRLQTEAMFGPLPQDPLAAKGRDVTLVVFLTGLITLADWIGSDEAFFALQDLTPDDETATLVWATEQATRALANLHWGETAPVEQQPFGAFFRSADGMPFAPNPLQTALAEMAAVGTFFPTPMGMVR